MPAPGLAVTGKRLPAIFAKKCEEGIQKFASDQGLAVYPWIEKRESNGGGRQSSLDFPGCTPHPGF